MQTIAPGDKCFIFPIVMESGYKPVEISIGEDKRTPYGYTSSTCYSNAFWSVAGRLISCEYDDYGRFIVDDTDRNKFILSEIFRRDQFSNNRFYKTEQGENQYHDEPFDPEKLNPEDPIKSLEYIWSPIQEHRVFVRNYKGEPSQFEFAVISKAAADYLVDMVNKAKRWDDKSNQIEDLIKDVETAYQEWPGELGEKLSDGSKEKHNFFFFRFDGYFDRGEGYRSFAHWYLEEILDEQEDNTEFTEKTKEILRDLFYEKHMFSGFEWFNIKVMPMIYASQDYDNEIGRGYAKFVNEVSKAIYQGRKDRWDEDEEGEED